MGPDGSACERFWPKRFFDNLLRWIYFRFVCLRRRERIKISSKLKLPTCLHQFHLISHRSTNLVQRQRLQTETQFNSTKMRPSLRVLYIWPWYKTKRQRCILKLFRSFCTRSALFFRYFVNTSYETARLTHWACTDSTTCWSNINYIKVSNKTIEKYLS